VPLTLIAPQDAGFLADEAEHQLEARGFAVLRAAPGDSITTSRRVTLPAGFTDSLLAARPETVRFAARGDGLRGESDRFDVQRAMYTMFADALMDVAEHGRATPESVAAIREAPRNVRLAVTPAGRRHEIPRGFAQAVPGTMVMFALLVMLTSSAVLLVIERREGLLRRMAATPITRGTLVLGKWIGRMMIGLVQIAFAMLAGTLLFRMNWGTELPAIGLLMVVYAGFNASLGLLLGAVARTQAQAVAIGVLSANVLAALGGCWWPIEITPPWMQALAHVLPTGIAMDALHQLVSFGAPGAAALPHVAVLAVAGAVIGLLAARHFRYA